MWLRFIFRAGFNSATTICATGALACDGPPGDATKAEAGATAAPLSTAQTIDPASLGEKSNKYLEVMEFSNFMFSKIPLGPATQTRDLWRSKGYTWDRFDILRKSEFSKLSNW